MFLRARVVVWSLCCWGALAVNENSTEAFSLRLVGGDDQCRGELQVQRSGQNWTGVWPGHVPLWFGGRVCAELHCGSVLAATMITVSEREAVDVFPDTCEDAALIRCFRSDAFRSERSLELNCSDSVRLVSGSSLCSGSVQIRDSDRSWTSVCEGALDRRGAEVLCRELGCGAPLLQGALSPLGQLFHCEGHESALMDCPRNQTRTDPGTCPPLYLTCSDPVRPVGGAGRCEGTVEVRYSGEWRRVWPYFEPWDLEAGAVVCQGLDCGFAVSSEHGRGFPSSAVWGVRAECAKRKSAVRDCVWGGVPGSDDGLKVACSDSVRLISGRGLCLGFLQIRDQTLNQSWTSVCEGALDRRGAEVLCRELGCGAPLLQGALSPLGQTFHCEGHESALMDCPRNQTRTDPGTCPPLQLTCSDLRLVGGASRCEGTVELRYRGLWGRMESYEPWALEAAAAVCRGLGCGSAVSTTRRGGFNSSAVWFISPGCMTTAAVRDCVTGAYSVSLHSQEVVCSGHQGAPDET